MAVQRKELIRRYVDGPAVLAAAVEGLSDRELDYRPIDGGWSPREIVHHTADSEMTSAIRLRRLLAEDQPVIQGYDGDEFARRLFYRERSILPSLSAVRAARESTASILEHFTDADWNRSGTHSESGPYSVDKWLKIYAAHCEEHAEQIRRAVGEARADPPPRPG
jgi:hypothetical protein